MAPGAVLFVARNLLDEVNDATSKLRLLDAHERLGEREPVGRGEEVEHVGRRGCLAEPLRLPRLMRRALRKRGDLRDMRNAGVNLRDAIGAFLVFLYLLECQVEGVAKLLLNRIPSIMRRIRTRLPTCLSMGFGTFLAIETCLALTSV